MIKAICIVVTLLGCLQSAAFADTLRVAVAANFAGALAQLSADYEAQTGTQLSVTRASSGTLYAQIAHGANIDVFLSADAKRPEQLIEDKRVSDADVHIYAIGRLGYIQRAQPAADIDTLKTYALSPATRVAIANPKLAPYGEAARQALTSLVLWQHVSGSLVYGNNVLQTYQFYTSGNVDHAITAWSLVKDAPGALQLPAELHQPIVQKLAVTASGGRKQAAQAFVNYLLSDTTQAKLSRWGYSPVGTLQ